MLSSPNFAIATTKTLVRHALDLILPPRCLGCGVLIGGEAGLCPSCWQRTTFLAPPFCAQCGIPFELEMPEETICGNCARYTPPYKRARAALVYDDGSRDLVLSFKHADRTDAAPVLAQWMARAGTELLESADLIAPVPLHWRRRVTRRYNQAALLAQALGRVSGVRTIPDLLIRRRATPSQGGLTAAGRRRNVRGAFAARLRYVEELAGKHVLLVDDVYTTGATVQECARALRRWHVAGTDVLTLARVVKPVGD